VASRRHGFLAVGVLESATTFAARTEMRSMARFWDCLERTAFSAMTITQKRKRLASSAKAAIADPAPTLPPALTPPPAAATPIPPTPPLVSAPAKNVRASKKRVRIGDALRQSGLDEWTIADGYVGVVEKLTKKAGDSDSPDKLLVDVLKECSRHLEPPRSSDSASDGPVTVRLVHNVSRPKRGKVQS
jgi:hypothetical protein